LFSLTNFAMDMLMVLNKSPYGDALDLWLVKTGRMAPKPISSFAEDNGRVTESVILAKHGIWRKTHYVSRLAQHDDFPFLAASLDGYSEGLAEAIECKFVGKEKYESNLHTKSIKKIIPVEHMIQVQDQMLVSGLKKMTYAHSMDRGANYKIYEVKEDLKFQLRILKAAVNFRWMWKNDIAPKAFRKRRKPIILKDGTEWKV